MMNTQPGKRHSIAPALAGILIALSLSLAACATPGPTPTPSRTPKPTFTPAPISQAIVPELVIAPTAGLRSAPTSAPTAAPPTAALPTAAPTATALPPTMTPEPAPRLSSAGGEVNARSGPGTAYPIVGTLSAGQWFEVVGKNAAGDWWQICCLAGQRAWVAGSVVTVENTGRVPVVTDIPPAPTARPQPTAAPTQAPAAADPCANIGGDGCKFRVTGGPSSRANGGQELKLQLFFMHSGVEGGQPQGSYFIALEKDGVRLPIPDSVRSIAKSYNEGPQGRYNYEHKLGLDQLPGKTVVGSYVGWVLDGNGVRDSQNFTFRVAEGQGEVWIQFDQNR